MPYEIGRRMSMRLVAALALAGAALGARAAVAGGHVAIALLPPEPVTSPPVAAIPAPAAPAYSPPVLPAAPLAPQVTYFTPPQAVPVIVPERERMARGR